MNQGSALALPLFSSTLALLTSQATHDISLSHTSYLGMAALIPCSVILGLTDIGKIKEGPFWKIFETIDKESTFMPVLYSVLLSINHILWHFFSQYGRTALPQIQSVNGLAEKLLFFLMTIVGIFLSRSLPPEDIIWILIFSFLLYLAKYLLSFLTAEEQWSSYTPLMGSILALSILIHTLMNQYLYKEKMNLYSWAGTILGIVATILINIGTKPKSPSVIN